jgi:N-carbamoylputrescine amidase
MEKPRIVTLALVQMSCCGSREDNLPRALQSVADAAKQGAQVVVLPELFLGPYFCQRPDDRGAFALAEPIPGPTTAILAAAAQEHGVVLLGGSLFEKTADNRFFNTAVIFEGDGRLLGIYRKTHIPEDLLYHEQHYFAPGDTGIRVFETSCGKIAPLICYDQWYPEAARLATLQGAEILVYPTAIGRIDEGVEENVTGDWETMWRAAQVGHAAVNNVYVAAVNRVGREGALTFWGGSFVGDPAGAVLAQAGSKEELLMTPCDLNRVGTLQKAWRFLENRRPGLYRPLAKGNKY